MCKIFDIDSGRFEIWSFLSFLSFLSEFQNHHVLVLSRREEREQSRTRDTHKEMRIKQNTETRTSDFLISFRFLVCFALSQSRKYWKIIISYGLSVGNFSCFPFFPQTKKIPSLSDTRLKIEKKSHKDKKKS